VAEFGRIRSRHRLILSDAVGDVDNSGVPDAQENQGRVGYRLITDEGVAVGGAFDSDTATGMMPVAHRVAGLLASRRS
jgi:hypothetical protein